MSGIVVTLTFAEMYAAAQVGILRHIESRRKGLINRLVAGDGWQTDIEGALGECALAKCLNLYWGADVNTFHAPDLGKLQIRTGHKDNYRLIVRSDDNSDDVFVLVTGTEGHYTIRGWLQGSAAKQQRWWCNPNGDGWAFFVPQSALNPINTLEY